MPQQDWFKKDFSAEKKLLSIIRDSLANGNKIDKIPDLNFGFDSSLSHIAITLFHEDQAPIRWISKRKTLIKTINRITYKLRQHPSFGRFEVANPGNCRIMLEVITAEYPFDIKKLSDTALNKNRYEPGITGFKLKYEGDTYFYMPTDAAVNSHLTSRHALNFISKRIGIAKETNRISERIEKLLSLPIEWSSVYSVAFITYFEEIVPLYRGYPYPMRFSESSVSEMARTSVDWIYNNMNENGQFLYYYDGVMDTVIDHVHPTRTLENNYYNMLRHSGGIISMLMIYELTKDAKYVRAADRALNFLTNYIHQHTYDDRKAYYVYFNDKAKLGGTGLALVAFLRYRKISNDEKYDEYIHGLASHLLSRIMENGEMIGYYIHPSFNGGKPIIEPAEEMKKQLYSFYYPGEVLLGLALYDHQMDLSSTQRKKVRDLAIKALDFLIKTRPIKYKEMFKSLPSDSWLMQAIEEWSRDAEFRREEYFDFVFDDAEKMISHMYTARNSLYRDYPGTFFYNYGDHSYIDGARAEGLISAYYLAKRLGKNELAEHILDSCKTVAESLMYSYNSGKSTFMHRFPRKSIGSFRFKFTRHWVRIDTLQHTACFFVRLLFAIDVPDNNEVYLHLHDLRDFCCFTIFFVS